MDDSQQPQSVLQLASSLGDDDDDNLLLEEEDEEGAGSSPRSLTPKALASNNTNNPLRDSGRGMNNNSCDMECSPRSASPTLLQQQPIERATTSTTTLLHADPASRRRERRRSRGRDRETRPRGSFKKKNRLVSEREPPIRNTFYDDDRRRWNARRDASRWPGPEESSSATVATAEGRPRRRRPYRSEVVRHRNVTAVLAVDGNGYTLSNGVESWCHDNVRDWEEIAYCVDRMGVLDLYLVDRETEQRWWNLSCSARIERTVRVSMLNGDGSEWGECQYCGDADCHRWKAIVGGIARVCKRSAEPIIHDPWC